MGRYTGMLGTVPGPSPSGRRPPSKIAPAILRRPIAVAAGVTALLAGCALLRPTPVPSGGRLDVPQPTATQIAVGANPLPTTPRMNPFVAQVGPSGGSTAANPYGWLEDVHSTRTRHWIRERNQTAIKALAALPQRPWIERRLEQLQAEGRVAPNDVVVEHARYLSADGASLPIEIAHRRNLPRDGNQPTLLTVYPSTGKPPTALLEPFALVWLELGGVYARAQVREGLASVTPRPGVPAAPDRSIALADLFAAGQSLIDHGYTRRARLGIYGPDFAGLMAGAAVALRPDFFGVALPTGTWAQYRRIASGNCFPPTLIVTAEHDDSINPWQGYELAAVLQASQICGRPILLRVDRDAGPGAPPAVRRERAADELAFAAKWLGLRQPAR